MRVFLEKEFVENFEIEFSDKAHSDPYRRLYRLFTAYPYIVCYINVDDHSLRETIEESEILSKLTDINPRIYACKDLKDTILSGKSLQTLVFTGKKKDWFSEINDETILMFCYDDFEDGLQHFLDRTHVNFDFSDQEMTFDWEYFGFITPQNNIIIISDPYILADTDSQKIKDNLLELLKQNLNKEQPCVVFIITEFKDYDINKRYRYLHTQLGTHTVSIYLINRIRHIENIVLHDRLLYTNYTITTSPSGFNIRKDKPINSELVTTSIFDYYTYKKYVNHIRGLSEYIRVLENYSDYNNTLKVKPEKTIDEFQNIVAERCF